jgi:hypothetical protein
MNQIGRGKRLHYICYIMYQSQWIRKSAIFIGTKKYLMNYSNLLFYNRTETDAIKPLVVSVLEFTDWRHICLKISAIRFLGGMANWLNRHPDEHLEKSLNFLVTCLPVPECSNAAAVALQVKFIFLQVD